MQPLEAIPRSALASIRYILTDIDDTLTREGKLLPEAYSALWRLYEAGMRVIPVTGRPAGWCDCIIRQWPVPAVVGENGAFALLAEDGVVSVLLHPGVSTANDPDGGGQTGVIDADSGAEYRGERLPDTSKDPSPGRGSPQPPRPSSYRDRLLSRFPASSYDPRLDLIFRAVKEEIPGARKAKDQFTRMYDLAVDFREDEPRLDLSRAERMKSIAEEYGAHAKVSSIHVNIWFGEYDKFGMTLYLMSEVFGLSEEDVKHRVLFVGDSPNDEPMFSFFPVSVGVANVREYERMMTILPRYCTRSSHGAGFAETAAEILERGQDSSV